jgi:hypothetical protein
MKTVRFRPARPIRVLGTYDLDAVALETDDDGRALDFRLELGAGLDIFWVVPIEPNGRLRLIHVDCAVAHVDPEVREDPCLVDLPPLEWPGLSLAIHAGVYEVRAGDIVLANPP